MPGRAVDVVVDVVVVRATAVLPPTASHGLRGLETKGPATPQSRPAALSLAASSI